MKPPRIVTDKAEAELLMQENLYNQELEACLPAFKAAVPEIRKKWTTEDLNSFLEIDMKKRIVNNYFQQLENVNIETRKKPKLRTSKQIIGDFARDHMLPVFVVQYLHKYCEGKVKVGDSKADTKEYVHVKIQNTLDEIEAKLEDPYLTAKDMAQLLNQQKEYMKLLAEINDLMPKNSLVSVNNAPTTNIDNRQIHAGNSVGQIGGSQQDAAIFEVFQKILLPAQQRNIEAYKQKQLAAANPVEEEDIIDA